jgi:hypothetical protein
MLTYVRKWNDGTKTPEDEKAAIDAMLSIPPEDLNDALITITGAVKTEVADKNAVSNAFNTIISEAKKALGVTKLAKDDYSAANDARLEAMAASLRDGNARMGADGKVVFFPAEETAEVTEVRPPLTPEQTAQAMADVERGLGVNRIWRAFRRITEPGLAPHMFKKGWPAYIEKNFFGALENVAPMALSGVRYSGLGYPLYMAVIAPSSYEQTMFENPMMDKRVASGMALIEGNVNWVGDNLQLRALKGAGLTRYTQGLLAGFPAGRLPEGWLASESPRRRPRWARTFLDLGKTAFQEILHKVNPNISVGQIKSIDQAMKDVWENLPDTAGQMFFITAFGVGALTYRDVRDPKKVLYNREVLTATGMDERTITSLLWEPDFAERDRMFAVAFDKLTPEQRNNGILYQQKQAEAIKAKVAAGGAQPTEEAAAEAPRPRPSLVAVTAADGTRRFNLLDENGTVMLENMSEEVAAAEYASYDQILANEERQRRVQEAASDEAVERTARAEQAWELLSPAERTTTKNVLEFSHNERPTPEQQSKLAGLQAALAAEKRPDKVVLVNADVPTTRAGLGAANFISFFERTFGKQTSLWLQKTVNLSVSGGLVLPSDPNTIFLDAAGDRNILALLGHEWCTPRAH